MEQMNYTTCDYNLTSLDHKPEPAHIASISTAVTIPAQTFQVGQLGSRNVFLQGSSGGGGCGGGIPGGFPTGSGGGGGGGSGGGRGGGLPAPAPAAAVAAASALNNNLQLLFGSMPPIFNRSRDKLDDFVQAFKLYHTIN
jgi:hypothetical protein